MLVTPGSFQTLHEPQRAAGILPAVAPPKRPARCRQHVARFMVPMRFEKKWRLSTNRRIDRAAQFIAGATYVLSLAQICNLSVSAEIAVPRANFLTLTLNRNLLSQFWLRLCCATPYRRFAIGRPFLGRERFQLPTFRRIQFCDTA